MIIINKLLGTLLLTISRERLIICRRIESRGNANPKSIVFVNPKSNFRIHIPAHERMNRHYLHSCRFFANFSVVSRLTLILYLKVPIRLMQTNYHLLLQQIARTQSVAWNNSLGEFSLSTHKKNLFITKTSR